MSRKIPVLESNPTIKQSPPCFWFQVEFYLLLNKFRLLNHCFANLLKWDINHEHLSFSIHLQPLESYKIQQPQWLHSMIWDFGNTSNTVVELSL